MADFTKLTIFVTRIENNKQVWEARSEFFSGNFPACSLVEVSKLATPDIYVEIEGIAHIGKGNWYNKILSNLVKNDNLKKWKFTS